MWSSVCSFLPVSNVRNFFLYLFVLLSVLNYFLGDKINIKEKVRGRIILWLRVIEKNKYKLVLAFKNEVIVLKI